MKENIIYQLNRARSITNQLIETLHTREDWLHQVHPHANHPLWIVAHLGLADNSFLSRIAPDDATKPAGWDELFWFGSEISGDADKYPATDQVLEYFRNRREMLLKTLDETTEEKLVEPIAGSGPLTAAPNLAAVFFFASWHEGMHTGQFTIAHRSMGNAPLNQPARK